MEPTTTVEEASTVPDVDGSQTTNSSSDSINMALLLEHTCARQFWSSRICVVTCPPNDLCLPASNLDRAPWRTLSNIHSLASEHQNRQIFFPDGGRPIAIVDNFLVRHCLPLSIQRLHNGNYCVIFLSTIKYLTTTKYFKF